MAIVTYFPQVGTPTFGPGQVTIATNTMVRVADAFGNFDDYGGIGLTFSQTTVTGGAVTTYAGTINNSLRLAIGGFTTDAVAVANFILSGQPNQAFALFLAGNDTINGSSGTEQIFGWGGNDTITAGGGSDSVDGGVGNDQVDGGGGNDTLFGGADNDTLFGGADNDALQGGEGNDSLDGGTGNDSMDGGTGSDTYIVDSDGDFVQEAGFDPNPASIDVVQSSVTFTIDPLSGIERLVLTAGVNGTGNSGANHLSGHDGLGNVLRGLEGNDSLYGLGGADSLSGGPGNDVVEGGDGDDTLVVEHDDGNDVITGGNGFDILDYSAVNGVVQINQLAGTTSGSAGNDTLLDVIEQVVGTNFDDVLSGGHGINILDGNGGNDQFFGNNGDDLMRGGDGDDTFYFSLNDGDDRLLGGPGFDILDYSSLGGVVQVNQLAGTTTGSANNDTLQDVFEMVIGSAFGDVLSGGHGINSLKGGGGDDTIFANGGDDYVSGGTGNDLITFGAGNDTIDFRNGEGIDTITDFVAGAGSEDTITLKFYSGLGTTTLAGLQAQSRISQVGADTRITLNGGDALILQNVVATNLHADDFIFT